MILVVAATRQELAFLQAGTDVDLLVAGIGPVEAAARTAAALNVRRYSLVVNAGIAGAFDPALAIGESVVVEQERLELDLETGAPLALPVGVDVCDCTSSDARIVAALAAAGFRSVRGITVNRVTATDATAARLRGAGAEVESMEGFSVLRAAELAGVRAVEVRGISNYAGPRANSRWDFDAGAQGLRTIVTALLAMDAVRS